MTTPSTNFIQDVVFEDNIFNKPSINVPTYNEVKIEVVETAGKAAVQMANAIPTMSVEHNAVRGTIEAGCNMVTDVVNTPTGKALAIGAVAVVCGAVVYWGGKIVCDKIFGNSRDVKNLVNNPMNEDCKMEITFNDGRTVNLSGKKASIDIDSRNITKIVIQ